MLIHPTRQHTLALALSTLELGSRVNRLTSTAARGGPPRPTTTCAATASGSDYDDSTWADRAPSPGTGARTPAFADSDGPLLYRQRFELDALPEGRASSSRSTASSTRPTCGSTAPTSATPRATSSRTPSTSPRSVRLGSEHVLAVEVACATAAPAHGEAQHHRRLPALGLRRPGVEPGRPVARRARARPPGRCASTACGCCAATPTTPAPTCACAPGSTATSSAPCCVRTLVDGVELASPEQSLAAGTNDVDWTLDIDEPAAVVAVVARRAAADRRSPSRSRSTARRATAASCAPGCARWPCRTGCSRSTASGCSSRAPASRRRDGARRGDARADVRADVELRREAGLDLRPRATATSRRPELYDAADELGMLVWQDFPLQWGYARTIRKQAVRQAREAVDLLGHHPSIVTWCAHNEPLPVDGDRGRGDRRLGRPSTCSTSSCRRGTRACSTAG